jgi:hypothetical protein
MNYTHINLIELVRLPFRGNMQYLTKTTINLYRDRSNDAVDIGRIGLSVYNNTMLLTLERITNPPLVKWIPICA